MFKFRPEDTLVVMKHRCKNEALYDTTFNADLHAVLGLDGPVLDYTNSLIDCLSLPGVSVEVIGKDKTIVVQSPPPEDKYVSPAKGTSFGDANVQLGVISAYLDLKLSVLQREVNRQLRASYEIAKTHNKG